MVRRACGHRARSGEAGEDAGAVAGFEDELGLGLPDDAVHGDVLKDEVAQGLGAFGGDVEVKIVFAGDVEGLEDAGHAGQVGVEPVDVVAVVAGAIVSVLLRGGFEQARRLTDGVRLFTHAVSLGGVDSLLQHPRL